MVKYSEVIQFLDDDDVEKLTEILKDVWKMLSPRNANEIGYI